MFPAASIFSGISSVAGAGLGILRSRRARKLIKAQRQALQQQRAVAQTTGLIDLGNQLDVGLSNRLSSALQFSGTSAEAFAQNARNLDFNRRTQLYQFDLQDWQLANQQRAQATNAKLSLFQGLVGVGAAVAGSGLGGAIASSFEQSFGKLSNSFGGGSPIQSGFDLSSSGIVNTSERFPLG